MAYSAPVARNKVWLRMLTVVLAVLGPVAVAQTAEAKPSLGVQVGGLPGGERADVRVSGPGSHTRKLTRSPLTHLGEHLEVRVLSEMRLSRCRLPAAAGLCGLVDTDQARLNASKRAFSLENALDYA